MQCKSGKSYFRSFNKVKISALFLGGAFLYSSLSYGVITLTPTRGGTLGSSVIASTTQGSINYYFFVTKNGSPALSSLTNGFLQFTPLDIGYGVSTDPSSLNNIFEFSIGTNTNIAQGVGQFPTVVVQAVGPMTGASPRPAPIASVNGVACNNQNCQAYNQNGTVQVVGGVPVSPAPFYAAKLISQPIRIGVYLKDICSDYLAGGVTLSGCTSDGSVNTPGSGGGSAVTVFPLKFIIQYATDGVSAPTGQVIDSTPNPVNLNLQSSLSTASCPSLATFNNTMRPDDSRIGVDTSIFSYTSQLGGAPAQNFYVVAQEQSAGPLSPVVNSTFGTSNSIVSASSFGGVVQATGFQNSDSTATHNYVLSFLIQDQTGAFINPGAPAACTYGPIQTAAVNAFLQKNGCFIATVAFGDDQSAPVIFLRRFRDLILMKFNLGRSFVDWYYDWSPELAQKLHQYPVVRLPVLMGLFYIQVFAWICLYPVIFFMLSMTGSLFAVYLVKRVRE